MIFALVRSAAVLSAASLLGTHSVVPPHDPTPQTHVTEASIWGANDGFKGYSFLPITVHGHVATVVIDLNCTECDLSLSTAALGKVGVAIANASTLDSMTIGTESWGSWKVEELDHIDAEELLPKPVPIMLLNLSMMRKVKLYNSTSSQQVCLSAPQWNQQH